MPSAGLAPAALAASGSGSQTRRLGYETITVTIEAQRLSEALKPFRAARAAALRETARWRKTAAAFAYGSHHEIRLAGQWHMERADGLEVTIAERLMECGGRVAQFMSPEGEIIEIATKCRQRLCRACSKSRAAQLVQRIKIGVPQYEELEKVLREQARALAKQARQSCERLAEFSLESAREIEQARSERVRGIGREKRAEIRERIDRASRQKAETDKKARSAWAALVNARERAKHRKLELVTFTVRHTFEPPALQARILREAWPLFRSRIQKKLKKALTMAKFEEASFTHETMRPHVHWHALVWLPPMCWSWLQTAWSGAVNSARRKITIKSEGKTYLRPLGCAGNVDISEKRTDSDKIAGYCSKAYHYVTKQALEVEQFDTAEGAEYLDYSYQKRWFTCTPGYFVRQTSDFEFIGFRNWTEAELAPRPIPARLRAVPPTGPPA